MNHRVCSASNPKPRPTAALRKSRVCGSKNPLAAAGRRRVGLRWLPAAVILLAWPGRDAGAQWQAGRGLEDGPEFSVGVGMGLILGLDGEVQETERPLYAYTDDHSFSPPEGYSWKELGFDDHYGMYGVSFQRRGRWATWRLDLSVGHPTVRATAVRDYYIEVGSISYDGREYTQMMIPEGREFEGEIDAYALALNTRITPTSYRSRGGATFTPWLHLGLFGFAGSFVVDAGEPEGVIQYQRPPKDFVVGGRGKGFLGVLVPELGLGAELEWPMGRAWQLFLQGFIGGMDLGIHSDWFGVRSENVKVVDMDYLTYGGRIQVERTLTARLDGFAGIEAIYRTGNAEVRAKDRPAEEVLALRERFDKEAHFEMTSVMVFIGLRF